MSDVPFVLERAPRTREELYWYVRMRYGFAIPDTQVCPDHCTPFQAFADAYFAENTLEPGSPIQDMALWHGSRGLSGKSFTLSLLATTVAELLGVEVNLLGGSLAQSQNIHEHVGKALDYERAPKFMIADRSKSEIRFTHGARVRPLTASQKTVRGPHPPRLLLDEIDEMDLPILDAALGQPLPQLNWQRQRIRPHTVMCSTWQNPLGTFTEILRRCEENGTPIYRWCYRESANPVDGWLSQDTIEGKRNSIPRAMWDAEYELGTPAGGVRAIDGAAVDAAFCLPMEPLLKITERDFEQYLFEQPERGGQYVVAADWARKQDYTVIAVGRIDVQPARLVYWCRVNRRPWPMMVDLYNKALRKYGVHSGGALHDATGLGDVIDSYLDASAVPFLMTGRDRDDMLTEYVNAVEKGRWAYPKITTAYTATKYCQVDDLYSRSQQYHLPDEVCALALLERATRHFIGPVAPVTVDRITSDPDALRTNGQSGDMLNGAQSLQVYRRERQDAAAQYALTV